MSKRTVEVGTVLDALRRAEAFMSGFEDDESQRGMRYNLSVIRAAIKSEEEKNRPVAPDDGGKKFTVTLMYPDYLRDVYGDTWGASVWASGPWHAVKVAQADCAKDCEDDAHPVRAHNDLKPISVFQGEHNDLVREWEEKENQEQQPLERRTEQRNQLIGCLFELMEWIAQNVPVDTATSELRGIIERCCRARDAAMGDEPPGPVNDSPRVYIHVEGGVVQDIITNQPMDVYLRDIDSIKESGDEKVALNNYPITFKSGDEFDALLQPQP